ncbi:MAG: hypothetical protein HKP52_07165 [Desulfofustis sp.]|nr:hypothetical protein [Desulfofustis sp.]
MNTLEPHLSVASAIEQMAEAHEQIESSCTVGKAVVRRKYCPHEIVSIH